MDIDFQPLNQDEGRMVKKPASKIDFQEVEDNNASIRPNEGKENFKRHLENQLGINPLPSPQQSREAGLGFSQGYLNSLIGMVNLLPKVNIPKADFAPRNEMTRRSELAGDIASYFGPRAALGVTKIPHLISNALKDFPVASAIMKNLGSGAEAALFGASHAPEGEKTEEAAKGGLIGSGMHLANSLLSHRMPLLARLGSVGTGAGLGYMFGHPGTGAIIGGLLPQLKGAVIGPSKLALAENALRDINPEKITKSMTANKALGTIPTPGQAAGSYVIQGREGALRKQAGKLGEDLEIQALDQQAKAGKSMLNKVYKPSKENEKDIRDAYKKAYDPKNNLPQNEVDNIKNDPILKGAFDNVKRIDAFKNIPENEYKFLTQVNRDLWSDYKALAKSSDSKDRITAKHINNARLGFDKYLKTKNPDYQAATKLAAPKMTRQELEEVKLNLHDEQLTGKNIYKRLLDTPKKYKDAQRILKPYPKALKDLKNMREGWREYANIKTGSQAEAQAKTRLDQARNVLNWVNDFLQSNIGKKATEAQLKYIHSPEWQKGFDLITRSKNQKESINKTLDLIGKMGLSYGLSKNEIDNLKSIITKSD